MPRSSGPTTEVIEASLSEATSNADKQTQAHISTIKKGIKQMNSDYDSSYDCSASEQAHYQSRRDKMNKRRMSRGVTNSGLSPSSTHTSISSTVPITDTTFHDSGVDLESNGFSEAITDDSESDDSVGRRLSDYLKRSKNQSPGLGPGRRSTAGDRSAFPPRRSRFPSRRQETSDISSKPNPQTSSRVSSYFPSNANRTSHTPLRPPPKRRTVYEHDPNTTYVPTEKFQERHRSRRKEEGRTDYDTDTDGEQSSSPRGGYFDSEQWRNKVRDEKRLRDQYSQEQSYDLDSSTHPKISRRAPSQAEYGTTPRRIPPRDLPPPSWRQYAGSITPEDHTRSRRRRIPSASRTDGRSWVSAGGKLLGTTAAVGTAGLAAYYGGQYAYDHSDIITSNFDTLKSAASVYGSSAYNTASTVVSSVGTPSEWYSAGKSVISNNIPDTSSALTGISNAASSVIGSIASKASDWTSYLNENPFPRHIATTGLMTGGTAAVRGVMSSFWGKKEEYKEEKRRDMSGAFGEE